MAPVRLGPYAASLLLLTAVPAVAVAQSDNHEEEDQRYQQRLAKPAPTPPPKTANPRDAVIAKADKLIRDSKDYTSRSTPHWQVRTDDAGVDAQASAALLESFRTWFESFWKG